MKHRAGCRLAFVLLLSVLGPAIAEHPPTGPRVALRFASSPEYELCKTVPGEIDARLLPLWMTALDGPDRDLHRQVADALVRAKALGMKGLDETVAARLRTALKESDHPVVRRSIAKALIALDDRQASEMFWEMGQSDYQFARVTEVALGTWNYGPAIEGALSRLESATTPAPLARLSMEMLANADEERAKEPLLRFAMSRAAKGDLRLTAASVLAGLFSQGLGRSARELCDRDRSADPLSGLVAVRLVSQHTDAESVAILQELGRDNNTAVQALALGRLGQIDAKEVAKLAIEADSAAHFSVAHPDANVRLALIDALHSIADAKAIPVLRTFLDDPHPGNRASAGDALYHLARQNDEFRALVEEQLVMALSDPSWRTLERAAIVAGGLDHEAAADLLVPLLSHERKEVAVASAWALKEMQVAETLPIVLKKLKENLDTKYAFETKAGMGKFETAKEQCSHLNEQLGLMKYAPAEPTLRRWIPLTAPDRQIGHQVPRATGIWALGMLHQDKPNPELTALLMARLSAVVAIFNTEPEIIGEASAYAVGLMKDPSGLGVLNQFAARIGDKRNIHDAAAWAVGNITGQPLPLGPPLVLPRPQWFLQPIEK
jgi:HEAT repeat protein